MSTEAWTVGRLLEWTTDYLAKHGSESPRLDAEVLLAEALACERIQLYTTFTEEPPDAARTAFRELVRRRAAGEPVAYLVGRKEFYSLSFDVSPAVLIPRPETEFLVIAALDAAKALSADEPHSLSLSHSLSLCDVGTGSGAVAVSLAKHFPDARITALDKSPEALDIARKNAAKQGVEDRVTFLESDLFQALPPETMFHVIASNPPYVSAAEYEALPLEIKNHEPKDALLAGPKGTEIIERLLAESADRLVPGGSLFIELSPMIHDAVAGMIEASAEYTPLESVKDLARLPRVVGAKRVG